MRIGKIKEGLKLKSYSKVAVINGATHPYGSIKAQK